MPMPDPDGVPGKAGPDPKATGPTPISGLGDLTLEAGAQPPLGDPSLMAQPWGPAPWHRYELRGILGSGGMGLVYRAWDPHLKREVALKFHSWGNPNLASRFLGEAQAQARIHHPHVCQVYEVGEVHGVQYIAMALVEGRTLREVAKELNLEEKVKAMAEVAEAIHAAHRLGIIHRDLKPANIMMSRGSDLQWFPMVLDFGLARLAEDKHQTRTGEAMGTPSYMSPEQAKGIPDLMDRRSDIYSLGVTLYELLAGETPFATASALEELVAMMTSEAPHLSAKVPNIPEDLETIVMKCLDKDPNRRYDSARALAEDLHRFLDGEPVAAIAPSISYRMGKWLHRNRTLSMVSGSALLLVLGLGAWGARTALRARAQAQLAERFGHEAQAMETDLRLAYSLPEHDTRGDKARVREKMKLLDAEMAEGGSWAKGPGLLAKGRAALSLDELEEARGYLQEAWKSGYRSPGLASALGLCLARLYQDNLAELAGKQRERRKAELEQELRQPAETYLRQALEGKPETEPYAEGLLALVQERYMEALDLARKAQAQTPWFAEAWILESRALESIGEAAYQRGGSDEALRMLDLAGKALERAEQIARSSPVVLNEESHRHLRVLQIRLWVGKGKPTDLAWAMEGPERLLRVDPDSWRALAQRADIYIAWGQWVSGKGEDALPFFDQGIEAARGSLRIRPDNGGTLMSLGSLYRTRSEFEAQIGQDPRPSLNASIQAFTEALRYPRLRDKIYGNLGTSYGALGEYQIGHGQDPTAALEQAIACHEKALAISPVVDYYLNLGFARVIEAQYQRQQGHSPLPLLEKAIAAEKAAIAINPKEFLSLLNLSGAFQLQAEFLIDDGRDAREALDASQTSGEAAAALRPDQYYNFVNLAQLQILRARANVQHGNDPTGPFKAGSQALAKAAALAPGAADLLKAQGSLELEKARWESRRGKVPPATVANGLARLRASFKANPADAECPLLEAELLLLSGRPGARAQAEQSLVQATRLNPNLAHQADALRRRYA